MRARRSAVRWVVLVAHLARRRITHGRGRTLHGVLLRVGVRRWLVWHDLSYWLVMAIVRTRRVGVRVLRVVVRRSRHGMGPRPREKFLR